MLTVFPPYGFDKCRRRVASFRLAAIPRRLAVVSLLAVALLWARAALAESYYVVSSTNDSGAGSLRYYVSDLNASGAPGIILFAAGAAGSITLSSGLALTQSASLLNVSGQPVIVSLSGASAVTTLTVGDSLGTLGGANALDISATTTSGDNAIAVKGSGSTLAIDSIAATGRISASAEATYATDAYGLYASGSIIITNAMAGSIRAAAPAGGIVYAMHAHSGSISIGSIAATGLITGTAQTTVYGLYAFGATTISGEMAGTIAVTATGGPTAYAIKSSSISIGSVAATGSISASATGQEAIALFCLDAASTITITGEMAGTISATTSGDSYAEAVYCSGAVSIGSVAPSGTISATANANYAYGIRSFGNVVITGEMAGTISATAGGTDAYGISATGTINGGSAGTPLAISGAVTAQAAGTAVAVKSLGAMNLYVTGTLRGVDTTGGGNGYSVLAGSANDSITLGTGASLTGKADLGAGTDTLTLVGTGTATNQFLNIENLVVGNGSTATNWSLAPASTEASTFANLTINANAALTINDHVTLTGNITDNGSLTLNLDNAATYAGTIAGSGSVTKSGTGTLTLTGANTYSGGTIFSAGTVSVAGYSTLGTGSLTFAGGTLTVGGNDVLTTTLDTTTNNAVFNTTSGNITVSGTITGTGSVTKTGTGTLLLTGINTYSGGTAFTAGTVSVAGYTALGSGSLTFAGGTLTVGGNDVLTTTLDTTTNNVVFNTTSGNITVSGTITGTGSVTKTGSGTLLLTGSNTYSGGTVFTAGTVSVADYTALGSGSLTFAGGRLLVAGVDVAASGSLSTDTNLVFDTSSGDQTVSSSFTGSGTITKSGAGILTLTGNSASFTGTTTITGGKVQVASGATVGGTVSVGSSGMLGGYGTVGTVVSAGTVSPGGSIGTLTVAGNYVQTASGNLLAEVSPTISDRLNVTGTATLAGTLTIAPEQGYYASGQSWAILTAAGGVTGTFASVVTNNSSWNLIFSPSYTASGVTVTVARPSYAIAAQSSRAASTAPGLDAAAYGATGEMAQLLAGLDFSSASATNRALNILSAETYDTYSQTLLEGARTLTAVQRGALRDEGGDGSDAFAGAEDTGPAAVSAMVGADQAGYGHGSGNTAGQELASGQYTVFLKPLGLHTNQYGDKNRTGYESYTGGLTGGVLYKPSAELTFGFAPAFMSQSVALRSNGSGSGTISDWSLALLAGYRRGPLYFDAVARGGIDHFESSRRLDLPGVSRTAKGSWNGLSTSLSVAGGYDFKAGEYTLGPIASLEWQYLHEDGFSETGAGTIGQRVKARNNQTLRTMVGGRITRSFESRIGTITPELRLGWAAQWLDQNQGVESSFIGSPGSNYRARVSGHAYQAAVIDAGVTVRVSDTLSASVRAGVELFRPDHAAQAVSVGFRYSF